MKRLDEVMAELCYEREEIVTWVEAAWVRPEPAPDGPRFGPVDVARLRPIHELRHDLAIDAEAMPVVLSLLDEVYGLRRNLAALAGALAEAPVEVRTTLLTRCRALLVARMEPAEDPPPPGPAA